jgi:hypothetical protein
MANDIRTIEKRIAREVIKGLLSAGFTVSVNDGEETTVKQSTDADTIFTAMMTTDEDYLLAHRPGETKKSAWVRFIYGNSGWDVINDYSTSLETVLTNTNLLADKIDEIGYAAVLEQEIEVMAALARVNAPAPDALLATLRNQLQAIMDHDRKLDDPNGDGSGDNAQSPTGDDYNEVCGLLQPVYDALGMVGPCSPYSERNPAKGG